MYESYDLCEVTTRANLVSFAKLKLDAMQPIETVADFMGFIEEIFADLSTFGKFNTGEDSSKQLSAPEGEEMMNKDEQQQHEEIEVAEELEEIEELDELDEQQQHEEIEDAEELDEIEELD